MVKINSIPATALSTLSTDPQLPNLSRFDAALEKFLPVYPDGIKAQNVITYRVPEDVHSVLFQVSEADGKSTYRFQNRDRNLAKDHENLGDGKTRFDFWVENVFNYPVFMMQESPPAPTLETITMATGHGLDVF